MKRKWQAWKDSVSLPQFVLMLAFTLLFLVVLIFPLFSLFSKAFVNAAGEFVGLENYRAYFQSPALAVSVGNTVFISLTAALISTVLGFLYAYALTRTHIRGAAFFRYAGLVPIFMPTVVHALALVYLFGKQGLVTQMGLELPLYGSLGIILGEVVFTFPQAYLLFYIALGYCDGRLYEAADSMGIQPMEQFFRVTLPSVKYTAVSCLFICFTMAFTDFGVPKVLGGSYNVLATDIYKQVAGQFNMNMGAVVGTLLLLPAVLSFGVERATSTRQSSLSARAQSFTIKPGKRRDALYTVFCTLIVLFFFALITMLLVGAFTAYFPYDMSFTLKNFQFDASSGGFTSYLNSLLMSMLTALFGTLFVFLYAYLIEKGRGMGSLKHLGRLLSSLPVALPGLVIGLSFIFFFNRKTNPLNFIYGTVAILVLANILHYYSVPYVTASTALKKLDKEYENVAQSMKLPAWKTFLQVSVPLSLPAILEIFMYYFVNSMVTVSALVFLYSANFKIGAIAITHMEEAGDFAQACAMSLLIFLINLLVRAVYEIAAKRIHSKEEKPRRAKHPRRQTLKEGTP